MTNTVHRVPDIAKLEELESEHGADPKKKTVVKWCASWCAPCRQIGPTYAEWAARFPELTFCSIDVDEVPEGSERYKISAMPTFHFWYGGRILWQIVGADSTKILAKIAALQAVQEDA